MKILFLTGSRGEWGYIRPILRMARARGIDSRICATNMHLLPSCGLTIKEIQADGFEVDDEIFMAMNGDNHFSSAKGLGVFLTSFVDVLRRSRPDWLVLAGDRGEQLMGAIAAAYTYTPVAHIQAGELSGNIDGLARHALGKLVHVHFAANQDAADRLAKLGEQPFRIHNVGAPQLDELVEAKFSSRAELEQKYGVDFSKKFLLMVQHPVTEEFDQAAQQAETLMEALRGEEMMKICIMPNNDAGGEIVRDRILNLRHGQFHVFENVRREDYLGLLKHCEAIVGNSSSGVLEAPTFGTPAVNIGRRQAGRVQASNVVNCAFEVSEIRAAIRKAVSPAFRSALSSSANPYGDGRSSQRILDILSQTPRTHNLLTKELTY